MAWMNSPENARLALRRPQELVPQPEAGDSREAHCRPDDRPSSRDLAEERPSGTNLHQRGLLVDYKFLSRLPAAFALSILHLLHLQPLERAPAHVG